MADEFRSNYGAPPPRQSGWSPVNVLSAIVGVLGIMALAIILISVIQRNHFSRMSGGMMHPPPPMMAPNSSHPAMNDSLNNASKVTSMNEKPDDVPPPATTNEIDAAPKPHNRAVHHSSPGFRTSNSVEAQEHLAEMRADGNARAKIKEKTKNGVTIYSVQ